MTEEVDAIGVEEASWSRPAGGQSRIEVGYHPSGVVFLRHADHPDTVLRYTAQEWDAFTRGARDGEFGTREESSRAEG